MTASASQELMATLRACAERFQAMHRDAELGLLMTEAAMDLVRDLQSSPAAMDDLEALLSSHLEKISGVVAGALGQRQEDPASTPPFEFRMDPAQHAVRIGRRKVPLTESEFKVLELLWEQMPSPVSRQMAMERLYGSDRNTTESVVDMFIFKIRQKLKNAGCYDAWIKSIRGTGWVLELEGQPEQSETAHDEEIGADENG